MSFNIIEPHASLSPIVKRYIVCYDMSKINEMLFLPDAGNFIVFNRGYNGYSKLYSNEEYPVPLHYSVSIKHSKVKTLIIQDHTSDNEPIILVELTAVGFHKLFNEDAYPLNFNYFLIQEHITQDYFSNLYTHESMHDEICYLNLNLLKLSTRYNSPQKLCIEDVIESIRYKHNFEVTVQELVEEFSCSRSTMERQFKKVIGLTPKSYIYISKLVHTLLEYVKENKSFHDTNYIYNNYSHINSVFQKIMGDSPSNILADVSKKNIKIYQLEIEANL